MNDVGALLREGLRLHQQGQPGEAIALYDKALLADPSSVDATYYRAAAICQLGDLASGIQWAGRALALDPRHCKAANLLGRAQLGLGRREEALASFDRAISIDAGFADAHANRARVMMDIGRFDAALESFERAAALDPRSIAESEADIPTTRARILLKLGRPTDALASLEAADHGDPPSLLLRGMLLGQLGRDAEALRCFERVLTAQPGNIEALVNRGTALNELSRHNDALAAFDDALRLKPDLAAAHRGRGSSLSSLRRFSEAVSALQKALLSTPGDVHALCEKGLALIELGQYDEALATLDQALKLRPDFVPAIINRGFALAHLRKHDDALASYRQAQSIDPRSSDAHFNEAELLLRCGDYARGWAQFEWRAQVRDGPATQRDFSIRMWQGETLREGTRILLHAEQGLGDTIQFIRYAPIVARLGIKVTVEVPGALKDLCRQIAGIEVVGRGERLPDHDLHCPLLSLPRVLNTTIDRIPNQVPYLSAPPERAVKWREMVPSHDDDRKVAIAWSGNPRFRGDHRRSMTLPQFSGIFDVPRVSFFCLNPEISTPDQAALAATENVSYLGARVTDFADTAAVVEQVDLVITTDTSMAHLAGAMGKPVWILLCHFPDWRWMLDRPDSPWYPTARLFRQQRPGDWESVVQAVRDELGAASGRSQP